MPSQERLASFQEDLKGLVKKHNLTFAEKVYFVDKIGHLHELDSSQFVCKLNIVEVTKDKDANHDGKPAKQSK